MTAFRDSFLHQFTYSLSALATAVYEQTGKRGILAIEVSEEVGLALGIVPGQSMEVATAAGQVTVKAPPKPPQSVGHESALQYLQSLARNTTPEERRAHEVRMMFIASHTTRKPWKP